MRALIVDMRAECLVRDRRIDALDQEFAIFARSDDAARRLSTIPRVGPLNATALVAAVGRAEASVTPVILGAWLGLVPRQHTTGGKPKLLGITSEATPICVLH
jgi:transposase